MSDMDFVNPGDVRASSWYSVCKILHLMGQIIRTWNLLLKNPHGKDRYKIFVKNKFYE